jgi:fatty-acyl-CoA synthase
VVAREGSGLGPEAVRSHLESLVAKWWIPERFEFVDEIPKTSVGKFDKKLLRARFARSGTAVHAGRQPDRGAGLPLRK